MSEFKTLLLRETGIARLEDGREGVNVGPIVAALGFLTEGRGEDRGIDEQGEPLPDLLSLAFDVLKAVILGGSEADYLRQVKRDFDAESGPGGPISLSLAKQASAALRNSPSATRASAQLRAQLHKLSEAAANMLLELELLDAGKPARTRRRSQAKRKPLKKSPARHKTEPSKAATAKAARSKAKPSKAAPTKPARSKTARSKTSKRR